MLFHMDIAIYYQNLGSFIEPEASGLLTKAYLRVDFFFILSVFIIGYVYSNTFSKQGLDSSIKPYIWSRFSR